MLIAVHNSVCQMAVSIGITPRVGHSSMGYVPPASRLSHPRGLGRPGHLIAGISEILLVPEFLSAATADELLDHCLTGLAWGEERLRMFGREIVASRLTCTYGEPGTTYRYSGVDRAARPWTTPLHELSRRLGEQAGTTFNFVVANRYRRGRDRIGWHADDERDLGRLPVIASISLGASRTFRIRPRAGGASVAAELKHGTLLLMWGTSQQRYKHCVPPTKRPVGERVNLTFRRVLHGAG